MVPENPVAFHGDEWLMKDSLGGAETDHKKPTQILRCLQRSWVHFCKYSNGSIR